MLYFGSQAQQIGIMLVRVLAGRSPHITFRNTYCSRVFDCAKERVRLHSKFVSHFFIFSRFIFAFYARCIETDIGKIINVQTNVVVICFVLLVCFLWGGFLSIFSMRFFVPFAINSFLQLIKALTLRFMIQGACIDESGRERE